MSPFGNLSEDGCPEGFFDEKSNKFRTTLQQIIRKFVKIRVEEKEWYVCFGK